MINNKKGKSTLGIHSGQVPDPVELSRGVAIHRTASYVFKDAAHARDLFDLKVPGNIYTRIQNPTQGVLEKRIAELEGGAAALAVASGTAAIFYSIINICSQGENFVSANNLYGGSYTQFDSILPQFGIHAKFVDPRDPSNFEKAIDEKTRALYFEAVGNPALDITDIKAVSEIGKRHHLPVIIDSTFATPYLVNPIEYGADIVIHSLTKWIGGHGTAIGGIVVDAGKFNWKDPKFKLFNEPDTSYHGLRWAHDLGEANSLAYILRMRTVPLRNLGACITPDNAWIFLQGLETLSVRMKQHCENALQVAKYLENNSQVSWVKYPGLESHPGHQTAKKYFKKGFGGVVVFGIKGGVVKGTEFIESLQLFSHLANVGDAKSLAIHPASTTHSQLNSEQMEAAGITQDMVRLSVGIEDIEDIIADLEQAFSRL